MNIDTGTFALKRIAPLEKRQHLYNLRNRTKKVAKNVKVCVNTYSPRIDNYSPRMDKKRPARVLVKNLSGRDYPSKDLDHSSYCGGAGSYLGQFTDDSSCECSDTSDSSSEKCGLYLGHVA